eukprot:372262-Pyramimonas_sp.AAC.1
MESLQARQVLVAAGHGFHSHFRELGVLLQCGREHAARNLGSSCARAEAPKTPVLVRPHRRPRR